jgi:TolA-binding protein
MQDLIVSKKKKETSNLPTHSSSTEPFISSSSYNPSPLIVPSISQEKKSSRLENLEERFRVNEKKIAEELNSLELLRRELQIEAQRKTKFEYAKQQNESYLNIILFLIF